MRTIGGAEGACDRLECEDTRVRVGGLVAGRDSDRRGGAGDDDVGSVAREEDDDDDNVVNFSAGIDVGADVGAGDVTVTVTLFVWVPSLPLPTLESSLSTASLPARGAALAAIAALGALVAALVACARKVEDLSSKEGKDASLASAHRSMASTVNSLPSAASQQKENDEDGDDENDDDANDEDDDKVVTVSSATEAGVGLASLLLALAAAVVGIVHGHPSMMRASVNAHMPHLLDTSGLVEKVGTGSEEATLVGAAIVVADGCGTA